MGAAHARVPSHPTRSWASCCPPVHRHPQRAVRGWRGRGEGAPWQLLQAECAGLWQRQHTGHLVREYVRSCTLLSAPAAGHEAGSVDNLTFFLGGPRPTPGHACRRDRMHSGTDGNNSTPQVRKETRSALLGKATQENLRYRGKIQKYLAKASTRGKRRTRAHNHMVDADRVHHGHGLAAQDVNQEVFQLDKLRVVLELVSCAGDKRCVTALFSASMEMQHARERALALAVAR